MMQISAAIKFEPSLRMEVRRAFPCCRIPNPSGLAACPSCGGPALPTEIRDAEQIVATFPWHARVLFKAGDLLLRLARWIEDGR